MDFMTEDQKNAFMAAAQEIYHVDLLKDKEHTVDQAFRHGVSFV